MWVLALLSHVYIQERDKGLCEPIVDCEKPASIPQLLLSQL
jgi:hypothetical protein